MGCHLTWQVGNGNDIWIGIDPVIGIPTSHLFPDGLRFYLEDLDIKTLSEACNTLSDSQHYWYSAEELYLDGEWKEVWNSYTRNLDLNGIRLSSQSDSLIWDYNKKDGTISADKVYDCIVKSFSPAMGSRLFKTLWSGTLPRKIGCFSWLVLRNKVLT